MKSILLSLLIILSPAAFAGDPNQTIEEFFDDYISSYNDYLSSDTAQNIQAVTSHFSEPALQVPPTGEPFFALEKARLDKNFSYFLGLLQKKGVVKLEWEKIQIAKLTNDNALAANLARMFDKDGNIVHRSSSVYSVYRYEDGWKIAMIQSYPTENLPTLK